MLIFNILQLITLMLFRTMMSADNDDHNDDADDDIYDYPAE